MSLVLFAFDFWQFAFGTMMAITAIFLILLVLVQRGRGGGLSGALGGMGDAARLIGATPSTMPASETYTALQRGTVDAIGFPFTYSFAAYKLDEVADWYTTNMALGTVNCPTVFAKNHYDKLPAQYKKLLADLKEGADGAIEAAY